MPAKSSGGGFEKLRKFLEEASKVEGKTGWPSDATYTDGTKVSVVAEAQEYGTYTKPPKPRPFVRTAISQNQSKWVQSLGEGAKACLNGSVSPSTVLENTALMAAGDIAQSIKDLTAPALDEKTIKRKGFDKPLIDTGLMFQTVTGIVEPK